MSKRGANNQPASLVGICDDPKVWQIVRVLESKLQDAQETAKYTQRNLDMRMDWYRISQETNRKLVAELSVYRLRHGPIKII